jgi:two-component system, OmpR family, response regulator
MSDGRILVIDDSEFVLARVKSVLSEAGYEVQTTTQTVGAGRYLRACDLVLLDFHMPGIDGGMVLDSLKNAAQSTSSPCAFYLFTSDEEVATRYATMGFDGVIRNKGELDALVGQVRAAIRMKKMRQIARRNKPDSQTGSSAPPPAEAGPRPFSSAPPPHPPEIVPPGRSGTTPVPYASQDAGPHTKAPVSPGPPAFRRQSPPRGVSAHEAGSHGKASGQREPSAGDDDDPTADVPRTPT